MSYNRFFFTAAAVMALHFAYSQSSEVCFTDHFSNYSSSGGNGSGSNPNSWTLATGARIGQYDDPTDGCEENQGIITPGVGGNNPATIKSPFLTSNGASQISVTFDIFRFNANLNCNSWSDFSCPTSVDIIIHKGITFFTAVSDLVLPHNGPTNSPTVTVAFDVQNQLPAGTAYKIEIDFKPKSGVGNCVQPNTKYVIDNFNLCQSTPESNKVLDAYDDNLCPLTNGLETFSHDLSLNDLRSSDAVLHYSLVNGPYANGNTETGGADLLINSDGTFTITRTDHTRSVFDFTYRVTDNVNNRNDIATCTVCFTEQGILPLDLISIGAFRRNNLVTVTWKTAMESNLSVFEVQRKINGQFMTIGQVQPKNMPNGAAYTFNEVNNAKSFSEYRIKSVEAGNVSKYSHIRSVNGIGDENNMLVFPNPSFGSASVLMNNVSGAITVEVLDNTGRVIKRVQNSADNSVRINGLNTGVYMIRATDMSTGISTTKKLLVEK